MASATTAAAAPAAKPHRIALGTTRTVALTFHLRPVDGADAVYAVYDAPDGRRSLVRRIDDTMGPVQVLEGRGLAAVLTTATGSWWLTAGDGRLCVSTEGPHDRGRCARRDADEAFVLAGETPVLLRQRPVPPPEEGRGPSKRKPESKPSGAAAVNDDAVEMEVSLVPLKRDGSEGEPVDTALRFKRPLEGMDVIAAEGTPDGARILYFEHIRPRREGRRWVRRARLRAGRLDAQGKWVKGSAVTLYEGDRRYGYIEGHLRPRLWVEGPRAVFTERRVDPQRKQPPRFEGFSLSDKRAKAVSGSDARFIVAPATLGTAVMDDAACDEVMALDPRRDPAQTGTDAGRVLWAGGRGHLLRDGAHWTTTRAGVAKAAPHPFEASRSRIRTAGWSGVGGEGLAWVDDELVRTEGDRVSARLAAPTAAPAGRPVAIGPAWWGLVRPASASGASASGASDPGSVEARVLVPTADSSGVALRGAAGEVKLVGGETQGWWLTRRGATLEVRRLGPDGRLGAPTRHPTPVRGRWAAVASPGGGALVVGRDRVGGDGMVAAVLDEGGSLSPVVPLGRWRAEARWSLDARPGGAWLRDLDGGRVTWLGPDGTDLGSYEPPGAATAPPCVDGDPVPPAWPADQPNSWVLTTGLSDACHVGGPLLVGDAIRWMGTRTGALHSEAELAGLPATTTAGTPAEVTTAKRSPAPRAAASACPPDMVDVGSYCVDRYEARLWASGQALSPHYPPAPKMTKLMLQAWAENRWYEGGLIGRALRLPPLLRPVSAALDFVARSEQGVEPSGFLTGYAAAEACKAAGKRLCSPEEWTHACKGQAQTKFPYGDAYVQGACNVFRYTHPARVLHHNPSVGHLDPRLNLVVDEEGPLRRATGRQPACASPWGGDAIYDMVGNLDEWVDDKGGAFAGGFYARSTRQGCDAIVTGHPRRYLDYSLGVRCCRDAKR